MKYLFSLIILLNSMIGFGQTFCLAFQLVASNNSTVEIDLRLQASSAFKLGTSNFQFSYNTAAVSNPTFVGTALTTTPLPVYQVPTVTEPIPGQASFNVVLNVANFGDAIAVAPDFTSIGTVQFDVEDANELMNLTWVYDGGSTGTVAFIDDNTKQIFATDQSCLNALNSLPLPLELMAFTAKPLATSIHLDWMTTAEENVKGFELQRTADGIQFDGVAWLDSKGNNRPGEYRYHFEDRDVKAGTTYYYRLKMVDNDESYSYSAIRAAAIDRKATDDVLSIYPNPSNGQFTVDMLTAQSKVLHLQIYNNWGTEVWQETIQVNKGINRKDLALSFLPAGYYFLSLTNEQTQEVVRKELVVAR